MQKKMYTRIDEDIFMSVFNPFNTGLIGRRGCLLVSRWTPGSIRESVGLDPWPDSLRCVHGQDTLLSWWGSGGGGGGGGGGGRGGREGGGGEGEELRHRIAVLCWVA